MTDLTDAERQERDDWHLTDDIAHEGGPGNPFQAAVRTSRVPMILTDPRQADNPIIFANQAFQSLTGYGREELIGQNCRLLQGPETDRTAVARIREAVAEGRDFDGRLQNYRKDGTSFWNALFVNPVRSEDGAIQFFFASQIDVTEHEEMARLVREQVDERTAELDLARRELHHRSKNNMSNIEAVLRFELSSAATEETRDALRSVLQRIAALTSAQQDIDAAGDRATFALSPFIDGLVRKLVHASGHKAIRIETELPDVTIPAADAQPVALIANEFITNSIKHAFVDRAGFIRVEVATDGESVVILVVDDGPGFDPAAPTASLGLGLATRMARAIGGTVAWAATPTGTTASVTIPVRSWAA